MEIVPFSSQIDETLIIDYPPINFLPIQYKPWSIQAFTDQQSFSSLNTFILTKEDGTIYNYGGVNTGSIEWLKVTERYDPAFYQYYEYPYRWNLTNIIYPDGSSTSITYQFQNSSANRYYRRYETVMIDRSDINNNFGNYFGNIPTSGLQPDWVLYEYAHPTRLETDTHYLVFDTSSDLSDSTNRNCRLNAIILYERGTDIELKRIVFHYAENNNPNDAWQMPPAQNDTPDWEEGDRLNNDQLTLLGFTIQHGEYIPPENPEADNADHQNYHFTYTTNPKMDIEGLETWGYVLPNNPEWAGYFYNNDNLAKAWRLETIILPTGGKYSFDYGTEEVRYDPEGNNKDAPADPWNYSSEPRCLLKSKKIEDGFDSPRTWSYTYSPEVIFDPPSGVYESSYVPKMYRNAYLDRRDQYYKWMRGCNVGHRWVNIANPDGSWKKIYYTSSYKGSGLDPLESKPDIISTTVPPTLENIIVSSRAGCRGIVWKEETPNQTTQYYYSYSLQGALKDRYDFFNMLNNFGNSQYILRTSYWARLDEVETTIDGVTKVDDYQYNQTPRENDNGNGLVNIQTNIGNNFNRRTSFTYAYSKYPSMKTNDMRSQLYSKTTSKEINNSIDDESKEFTTWAQFSNHWLPEKIYKWRGSSSDVTAPEEPTGNDVINTKTYTYDNIGYSNVITVTDANGFVTKYYYSDDLNSPFINNQGGLKKGFLTGIEYPQSSPLLRKSFRYDQFVNITHKTDENGNITRAGYDDLGRIISITDPLNHETENFVYYLPSDNNIISPSDPNSITIKSFRAVNDFTTTKYFYCGAGYERQLLTAFGDDDLIIPTTYDAMWRKDRSYKSYQVNLGINKHKYDVNYNSNAVSYYGFNYPYKSNIYYYDGTGRIKDMKPEGQPWQSHFVSYSYGSNSSGDVSGYSAGTLYKTSTIDENGIEGLVFSDKLGNNVQFVNDNAGLNLITKFENDVLGNMTKSIPPKGSDYATDYTYNTLSQLTQKVSPDAGTVEYLYDKEGNLRFTQDAKQAPSDKFAYQKYDELNRLTEVGEYTASGNFTQTNADDIYFPLESNPDKVLQKKFYYDTEYQTEQRNAKGNISKSIAYREGYIALTTFFSYDENNRIEWILHQIPGMSDKKIIYWYDWEGNIIKKSVSDPGSNTLYTFYEYDEAARLARVFTNTIDSQTGRVQEAAYIYNADGTVKQLQLANAQTMDYLYNERSWLTQINHQNLYNNDKFGEVIGYNNQNHIASGTGFNFQPQYNGNISWNILRTSGVGLEGVDAGYPDPIIGYVYNYDGANRLTKANFGYYNLNPNYPIGWSNSLPKAAMYDLPLVSYDNNGNILNLQRKGVDAQMMDNFTYAYQSNKNRLTSITNSVTSQTYNYGHDNNGNVTSDQFRYISGITYNISNLPEQLTANSSIVDYWYDNNGNRFRKQEEAADEVYVLGMNGETEAVFNADGTPKFFNINAGNETIGRFTPMPVDLHLSNTTLNGTYEATNSITVEDNVTVSESTTLKAGNNIHLKPGFAAPIGIDFTARIGAVPDTPKRFYYLKDHLGSIRAVVDGTSNIVSSDDYDPWGMILNGRSTNVAYTNANYKFTGKERDVETGYDYFGARYYDGRIGRWMRVDPLVVESPEISPYLYANDNPVTIVDLYGMDTTYFAQLQPIEVTAKWDWEPSNWWQVIQMFSNVMMMYPEYYIYNINKDLSVQRKQIMPIPRTNIGIVPGSIAGPEGTGIKGAFALSNGENLTIKGFLEHAWQRASLRGFSKETIEGIIQNGTVEKGLGKYNTLQYKITLNGNNVVIEMEGRNANKIITVWGQGPEGHIIK